MSSVLVLFADGFEEIEALTVVDILRRGDVHVDSASVSDDIKVIGAHDISFLADTRLSEVSNPDRYDAIVIPGGQPGSDNLSQDERVLTLLRDADNKNKVIAAICAGPLVLEAAGLTSTREGTSFPAVKDKLNYASYKEDLVVKDGNLITSRGPGTAIFFALEILKVLKGKDTYEETRKGLLIPLLQEQIQNF